MKLIAVNRSAIPYILSFFILIGLIGCGGGGNSGPLPDQDASGIYTGTATVDSGTTSVTDLKGIIYNNRFMIFSELAHVLYDGTITSITSTNYTATVDVYETGVKTQTAVAVIGQVRTATSITGTIGSAGQPGNHNGTFNLAYDAIYNRDATPGRIEGDVFNQWSGIMYDSNNFSNTRMSISISPQSFISHGLDTVFCDIVDTYSIPLSTVNIYQLTDMEAINGNSCPYLGTGYSGFATVVDSAPPTLTDDVLWVVYTNGTNSVFGTAMRL